LLAFERRRETSSLRAQQYHRISPKTPRGGAPTPFIFARALGAHLLALELPRLEPIARMGAVRVTPLGYTIALGVRLPEPSRRSVRCEADAMMTHCHQPKRALLVLALLGTALLLGTACGSDSKLPASPSDSGHSDSGPADSAPDSGLGDSGATTDSATPSGIALELRRLNGGSGSAFVGNGIPLQPGMLRADELSQVRLFVGDLEKRIYVEPLHGLHKDGSLRSILVQLDHELGADEVVAATLRLDSARQTSDLERRDPGLLLGSKPLPEAVSLPTDPAYLHGCDLVGRTPTLAQMNTFEPLYWQRWETGTRYNADPGLNLATDENGIYARNQWLEANYLEGSIDGIIWQNYYDRALSGYRHWVMTGDAYFFRYATLMAMTYRDRYWGNNGYLVQPHQQQIESQALLYWLTGDNASRSGIEILAKNARATWWSHIMTPESTYSEGRIVSRTLDQLRLAHLLDSDYASGDNRPWNELAAELVESVLARQGTRAKGTGAVQPHRTDGSWRVESDGYHSLNFMSGMLVWSLLKYHDQIEAKPEIPSAIVLACDFFWSQWHEAGGGFSYGEANWQYPDGQWMNDDPTSDLNQFIAPAFGFAYAHTGDTTYRDRGDLAFRKGLERVWLGGGSPTSGEKQFNQQFQYGALYLAYRLAGD
jgi:hypothetical protein